MDAGAEHRAFIREFGGCVIMTLINQIYSDLMSFWYSGNKFICPICNGHFRKFLSYGVNPRPNAKCPKCGSLERQRLLWLYLKNKTNFFTAELNVLEIAPMSGLQERYKKIKNINYVSADLFSPIAMIKMDITNIILPDNQFDCILCYHVFEHNKPLAQLTT